MKKNVKEFEIKLDKEWNDALDKAYKKKVKEVKIDGFRKGAAPKEIYIKKFGIESLYMDAVDEAMNVAYKKLLTDNKDLVPAIEPKVDVTGISDSNVIFKFTIITRPEIKLGEYKNLGIKKEKAKVTAEEVDAEIKALQDQMADLTTKEGGKVENGDTAVIDFKGFVDGELLEGGSAENYSLEIGSNSFIPGFEEGLVGKKVGDEVTLDLTFPAEYVEHLKNKPVKFEVKVNEIKTRIVPEINEDFFKDLGYEDVKTLDDLKKQVKEYLASEKDKKLEDEYIDKCLTKAADNMEVDINEEIIDEEVHHMMHQYEDQLKMQGLDLEKFYELTGQTHEDLHKNMEGEATKRVKYRYLIEEVAKAEKIEFTEKEVEEKAKEMAENYGITVDELIKAYGTLDIVKYDMTMHKALEIIKEGN
ncbi:MAG: trigger factor [Firmicutes bacterium]|nr:trigger factor [Bacillota bacterium]